MRTLELQSESIQISAYCDIIYLLLKNHQKLSIWKTAAFTYIIKREQLLDTKIYNAQHTRDLIQKGLSFLAGDFENFSVGVPYIIKAIHLLINANIIKLESNLLTLTNTQPTYKPVYNESNFLKKVIEESKLMTDRQFMREVIFNV